MKEPYKYKESTTNDKYPNIAQLAERPTVEETWSSGGPWFESGCSDNFLYFLPHLKIQLNTIF